MQRSVFTALACLSLFLLFLPLTPGKPGLPSGLKADEPAYYMMAASLAHDRDLRLEVEDVDRVFREFPFRPVNNLILMTDDDWRTVYYGKPFLYSLFAAPFVALLGANGLPTFNMLLMIAMVWTGTFYLRRHNSAALAALFSSGFFLLSVGFAYVFWMQPEVFNMAAVTACLFLGFKAAETRVRHRYWLAALSGAALALAVYNKPMLAALALAPLYGQVRRGCWKGVAAWFAGMLLTLAAVVGLSTALTGHGTSYLGVRRKGVQVCEPGKMPIDPVEEQAKPQWGTGGSWVWIFRPRIYWRDLTANIGYFLWGRHTGLFLYLPFAALATALFLLHERRCGQRLALLASLGVVSLFLLVFISQNWQGGGGFIGNRYFVNAYPGFLFLVTRLRPRWAIAFGYSAAGLFLGTVLLSPFGRPVPEPTLQSHVRAAPLRYFPLELSLREVPGYQRRTVGDLAFLGRRDNFLPLGERFWLRGADEVELYVTTAESVARAVFQVQSLAPDNRIEIEMGEAREVLELAAEGETRTLELTPGPGRKWSKKERIARVYRMVVASRSGRIEHWTRQLPPNPCPYFAYNDSLQESFYVGAVLTYLGSGESLDRDIYDIGWGSVEAPARVAPGESFLLPVRVVNRSGFAWEASGAADVALSYHWLDRDGEPVIWDGLRTDLDLPVPPGGEVAVAAQVVAPQRPGSYVLELDPLLEHVSWFSLRNGGRTYRTEVEVALPARGPKRGSDG